MSIIEMQFVEKCNPLYLYYTSGLGHMVGKGLGHILFTYILEDGVIDYSYIFWRNGTQIIHIQIEGGGTDYSHTFWMVWSQILDIHSGRRDSFVT